MLKSSGMELGLMLGIATRWPLVMVYVGLERKGREMGW
jgi:hypothetical protein